MRKRVVALLGTTLAAMVAQMPPASAQQMERAYVTKEAFHCIQHAPHDDDACDAVAKITLRSKPTSPFPWVVYGKFEAYDEGVFVSGGNRGLSRWRLLIDGVDATGWREIPPSIGCITWGSRMGMECVHSAGRDITEGKLVRLDVCMDWNGWQCHSAHGKA